MLTANYKPAAKWDISLSGTYTYSQAEMDMITFDNINGQLGFDPATNGMSMYDYNLSKVHTYSDLEIQQWDVSFGVTYQVSTKTSLSAGINYMSYDEDEQYLADESGSAYSGVVNLAYWFR